MLDKLPTELILSNLLQYLGVRTLAALLHVNSRTRKLLLSHPSLWTHIHLASLAHKKQARLVANPRNYMLRFPAAHLVRVLILDGVSEMNSTFLTVVFSTFYTAEEVSMRYCFPFVDYWVPILNGVDWSRVPALEWKKLLCTASGNHLFDSQGSGTKVNDILKPKAKGMLLIDVCDCGICESPVPETAPWLEWKLSSVSALCNKCEGGEILCMDCWKTGTRVQCSTCQQNMYPACRNCEDGKRCVVCHKSFKA